MATYTLDIPDEYVTVIFEAVAKRRGWTPTITDAEGNEVTNPISAADISKRAVIDLLLGETIAYKREVKEAEAKAELDAFSSAISLT